jgi:uncharacterized protein
MIKRNLSIFAIVFLFFTATQAAEIKTIVFSTGKSLKAEIAKNDQDRAKGLMFRKTLPEGTGMLFVFKNDQFLSFWMKNTYVPLTIGFFDNHKKLLEMKDMEPHLGPVPDDKLPRYESSLPARYALEVPKGWFKKNKVPIGATFKIEE